MNDHAVSNGSVIENWVTCAVATEWIRSGADTVEITYGEASGRTTVPDHWVSYAVAPEWIRSGANTIQITYTGGFGKAIVLRDVHVRITYPRAQ